MATCRKTELSKGFHFFFFFFRVERQPTYTPLCQDFLICFF